MISLPERTSINRRDGDNFRLIRKVQLVGRKKDKDNSNERLENEVRLLQHKLSSQEEEFRLQQSTLLSELNKVN